MTTARHGTLVASTVTDVALGADEEIVEVLNVDGAAPIYFTVDGSDPVVQGANTLVIPSIGGTHISSDASGETHVRLISAGTPKYAVTDVSSFGTYRRFCAGGGGGVAPLPDVRTYDTNITPPGGGSTGFTTLTKPGSSLYEQLVAATPGLSNWWTLNRLDDITISTSTHAFRPSAGSSCLSVVGGGSATVVPGIVPSAGNAVALAGGAFLESLDYWSFMGANEVGSVEAWVKFGSLPADGAIVSNWGNSAGWLLGVGGGDGTIFCDVGVQQAIRRDTFLQAGVVYHVVWVLGGTQDDYTSRLYVNGVDIADGLFTNANWTVTDQAHFNVGTYGDGSGHTHSVGTFQHIALYSRMLQPAEVLQHYNAAFL